MRSACCLFVPPSITTHWLLGGAAEMGGKQHICRFHPRTLREALEQNGFRVTRRGSVYHLSPFVALVAPRLAEKIFTWELGRGGSLGPILYSVAESATHEESGLRDSSL